MTNRDGGAEALYVRLCSHITDLENHPETTSIDTRLFEEAALILPEILTPTWGPNQISKRDDLMRRLAAGLLTYPQPAPAADLLVRLFDGWSWAQVCDFSEKEHPIPYSDGLNAGDFMAPFNKLMLSLLEKAATNAVDAAHAAGMLDTVRALVRCWLCTPDAGVAAKAGQLLLDLLKVDREVKDGPDAKLPDGPGQGLVWKRVFGDRDVYAVFYDSCSEAGGLPKAQRTIAQARLMEFIPQVGTMNWDSISKSQHPDIEKKYGVKGGLLDFAALVMVDYKDDLLMYRCLIDFYSELLKTTKSRTGQIPGGLGDSVGVQYMITHGLHARVGAIYLQLHGTQIDPVESMFLYGPAANYLATYASCYPENFLANQLVDQINDRLMQALDISAGRWSHDESPKHDLHLLSSLPRAALLPTQARPWNTSPLSLIPSSASNSDALSTLATVFHGPEAEVIEYPASSPLQTNNEHSNDEAATARALYFHYLSHNPLFWSHICKHANTVALVDVALAAIRCLKDVITANWSPSATVPLPKTIATPETGPTAILAPPALEHTLPYLFAPAVSFASIVGGRGDTESAAYKVARAKFEALEALHDRLGEIISRSPGEGYEEIRETIGKVLAAGMNSREGEVGGQVATMEM